MEEIHPKVIAGTSTTVIAGAVTAIGVYVLKVNGVDIPSEVASAMTVLIAAALGAVAGYLTPSPQSLKGS